ncbi:MAG: type IV pilus twitching motility protein PilT [Clostridium sp.]
MINLNEILEYAKEKNATDIHLIVGSKPMVRVVKKLQPIDSGEILTNEDVESLIKTCMQEHEAATLESKGEVDFSFTVEGLGRFRANAFKQSKNFSIALRRISESIPAFEDLNLPESIRSFTQLNKGLVLVTGVTGSGKSTTLASLIDLINKERYEHIITIEDPIEYVHKHKNCRINQREIGNDTLDFTSALRAALRQDPDVILLGEMRDRETIQTALLAAETGHLVFSTLHTMGAAETIDRIIDAFPLEHKEQVRAQLAATLKGVVSQELIAGKDKKSLKVATEVMVTNSAIQNLIREGKTHQINSTIQTSANIGMHSMDKSLARLVKSGDITVEEAYIKSRDKNILDRLLLERWT